MANASAANEFTSNEMAEAAASSTSAANDDRQDTTLGSDDELSKCASDDSDGPVETSVEERITLAMSCKDYGNIIFKECNFEEANQKYSEGLKHLKGLTSTEAKQLIVQLNSNSCICNLRLEQWQSAISCANEVLQREPSNVKALYRRGLARRHVGAFDAAKDDMLKVLSYEPNNADARKELTKVKEILQKEKEDHKRAYSGIFQKASGLYDDREAEMRRKRLEAEEEKQRKQVLYEKEMAIRKESGKEEISFEEWSKEDDSSKSDNEKKPSVGGSSVNHTKPKTDTNKITGSNSTIELDEEDEAIIKETKKMGYCYFRRELTDEERMLNSLNKPQKIESNMQSSATPLISDAKNNVEEAKAISSWNSAGTTYEEKDVTSWAKDKFIECVKQARTGDSDKRNGNSLDMMKTCLQAVEALKDVNTNNMSAIHSLLDQYYSTSAHVIDVSDISGDAHIAVLRGTRRFLFEFKCTIKFEITGKLRIPMDIPNEGTGLEDFKYSGSLILPEVSSAEGNGMNWLDGSTISFSPNVRMEHRNNVDSVAAKLKESIVKQIQFFLEEYKRL